MSKRRNTTMSRGTKEFIEFMTNTCPLCGIYDEYDEDECPLCNSTRNSDEEGCKDYD